MAGFCSRPSVTLLLLVVLIHSTTFKCVQGLDFGFSSLVGNFSSGVSAAAKLPADAIASTYEKVRPGQAENETQNESSTTTPNSTPSRISSSTTTTTTDRTRKPETDASTTTSLFPKPSKISNNPDKIVSTTEDDGEEATTESGSWVPDAIKKPFESVAAIPNKVVTGAGDALNVVSETVVNQDPEHSVKFYLYDDFRDLNKYKQIVLGQPDTLRDVNIPEGSRLNFLIHGFMQDYNSSFPQKMKDAFLLHNGGQVITVDWGHMAEAKIAPEPTRAVFYPFIVDNVPKVGEYVGKLIVFLKDNNAISSFDQVHILGFSLGAHVSGIAGWTVQNKTDGEKVARISGLDPAGPKFFLKSTERRLNEDDAKFVDVIHTSHLGYFLSMGHIDFFPNGGKIQPGCVETESTVTDAIASLGTVLTGSCSHARAWEYYTQSIKDNGLFGCECDNLFKYEITGCEADCEEKVPFGEPTPPTARGNYYLSI